MTSNKGGVERINHRDEMIERYAGSRKEQVAWLLDLIEAPEDLRLFGAVSLLLQRIILVLREPGHMMQDVIDTLPIDEIENTLQTVAHGDSGQFNYGTDQSAATPVMRGYCKSNPLYAVLLNFSPFPPDRKRDYYLSSLLVAYVAYREEISRYSRIHAGLAFRATFEIGGQYSLEGRLPAHPRTREELVDEVLYLIGGDWEYAALRPRREDEALLAETEDERVDQGAEYIAIRKERTQREYLRILMRLLHNRLKRRRSDKKKHRGNHAEIISPIRGIVSGWATQEQVDRIGDAEETNRPRKTYRHIQAVQKMSDQELNGAHPVEYAEVDRGVADLTEHVDNDAVMSDIVRKKYAAKGIDRSIGRANRPFLLDWRQFNAPENNVLIRELKVLSRARKYKNVSGAELASLIATMWCLSHTSDKAYNLRFSQTAATSVANTIFLQKTGKGVSGRWYMESLKVGRAQTTADFVRQIMLTTPNWVVKIYRKAIETGKIKDGGRIHVTPRTILLPLVKRWCADMRKKHPESRITEDRISHGLYRFAMSVTSLDPADVAHMFGREHITTNTQLYYMDPDPKKIDELYSRVVLVATGRQELSEKMQLPLFDYEDGVEADVSNIPNQKNVKRFCNFLIRKGETYNGDWVDYHNYYTLYTMELFALATGARAVNDMLSDPRLVDYRSGFCALSDKDQDDAYSTRVVWVPELVRAQLRNYFDHLRRLKTYLAIANIEAAEELETALAAWQRELGSELRGKRRLPRVSKIPVFFFVERCAKKLVTITQKIRTEMRKDVFPFANNKNRAYMRRRLAEKGVGPQLVNAWIGHWDRGTEPWRLCSTLSPRAYARIVGRCVEAILGEDGWVVVRSLL